MEIRLLFFISAVLLLIAAFLSIRILYIFKGRARWILIALACLLLAINNFIDYSICHTDAYPLLPVKAVLSIIISFLLAYGITLISRILLRIKHAESLRRQSEHRFNTLFNSTTDEIFLSDMQGNIVEVNSAVCDTLGFTYTELVTMNMNDLCPAGSSFDIKKIFDRITMSGQYIFEAEHISHKGTNIPVEFKCKIITLDNQQYITWTARDIRERKEMEQRILSAVIETEERERERFAKDLHDGLGPLLSTIKLYVNELGSAETEDKEKEELIRYSNELIDEAVASTRTISNNLTPHLISKYGLIKAIDAFIKKINVTHKINIDYHVVNIQRKFSRTIELIFFRIITELTNNTLKHAQARNISIVLEESNKKLLLSYHDDGKGFDVDEALQRSPEGIGLKNIISRIQSINGSVTFYNHKVKGTSIKIKADIDGDE